MARAQYANDDPCVDIYFSHRNQRVTFGRRGPMGSAGAEKWRDKVSLPMDASASEIGRVIAALLRPVEGMPSRLSDFPETRAKAFATGHLLCIWTKTQKRSPYRIGATQIGMRRFAVRHLSREATESQIGEEVLDLWEAVRKARWPRTGE